MVSMVIEIPSELKALGEAMSDLVSMAKRKAEQFPDGRKVKYDEVEDDVGEGCRRIEREVHSHLLSSLNINHERVLIGGELYHRVMESSEAEYYTLAGAVRVPRTLYRAAGEHNGKTVDPVSVRSGALGSGWLPRTAQAMAFLTQGEPSRPAAEAAKKMGRALYARTSFETVSHLVGEHYLNHHDDIEVELAEELEIPAQARSISVSIDRVSIPMEEPRPKPPGRPRKDAARRPVDRVFRMAYCATITLHDETGNAMHTFRRGRMPKSNPENLCQTLLTDVQVLLDRRPDLTVVLLADGAEENWNLLRSFFTEETLGKTPEECLDFFHAVEKLAPAAEDIFGDLGKHRLAEWRAQLLRNQTGPQSIRRFLCGPGLPPTEAIHAAATYFRNHVDQMKYHAFRERGLPIASGAVEATCKSLVAIRMKRSGSRWKEHTGEHLLLLRGLALSDCWDDAMGKLFNRTRTTVREVA